jgi:hypothetical protein
MKKLLLTLTFALGLEPLAFPQTTTNNPGVPIFGAGGTSSGLNFVFVNGLGNVAYPGNFIQENASGIVSSPYATNALGTRVAFLSDHVTNWISPEQFGALGGANNDSVAFSNMMAFASTNNPGYGIFIRNRSYSVSNLVIPNNTFILGQSATINDIPGMTNFLIDASGSTNVTISGIVFKGTNFSALSGRTLTTESGVKLNQLGGNKLQNCTVMGFGGYSILVTGTDTGSGGWDLPLSSIDNCLSYSNYYGPTFWSTTGFRGEYISCKGLQGFENVVGVRPEAGNLMISASRFTGNVIGVQCQNGAPNGEHGTLQGCTINHNGQSASLTGISNGEFFNGCWFAADGGGGITMTNCRGVAFDSCYFDPMTILSIGGSAGWNVIENCEYTGIWGVNILVSNLDGTLSWYNNHSRDSLTGDWSHKYSIPITSGNFNNATAVSGGGSSPSPTGAFSYVSWVNTAPIFQVYKVPRGNSTNSLYTFTIQSITNQTVTLQINDITHGTSSAATTVNSAGIVNVTLTNGINIFSITNNWSDNISDREAAFVWGTSTNTTTYLLGAEYGY